MISSKDFIKFHKIIETDIFSVNDSLKPTDDAIRRNIIKELGVEPKIITTFDKEKRNSYLVLLKQKYSIRQIERITGISRGVIFKACKSASRND